MSITVVQATPLVHATAVTSLTATFSALPTSGDAIIAVSTGQTNTLVPTYGTGAVTDNQTGSPNSYANTVNEESSNTKFAAFQAWSASVTVNAGTFTVTVTALASSNLELCALDMQGLSGSLGNTATGVNDGGTASAGGSVTGSAETNPNLLLIACVALTAAGNTTDPATGMTTSLYNVSGFSPQAEASYAITSSTGTPSAAWTWSGTSLWAAGLVAYQGIITPPITPPVTQACAC